MMVLLKVALVASTLVSHILAGPLLSSNKQPIDSRDADVDESIPDDIIENRDPGSIDSWVNVFRARDLVPDNDNGTSGILVRRKFNDEDIKAAHKAFVDTPDKWPVPEKVTPGMFQKALIRVQFASASYQGINIQAQPNKPPGPIVCKQNCELIEKKALPKTVITKRFQNIGKKTQATGYIAVSPELRTIFVVFRGTSNWANTVTDAKLWTTQIHKDSSGNVLCETCIVHQGFWNFASYLQSDVLEELQSLIKPGGMVEKLEKAAKGREKFHVDFIGHSLGAAAVQIMYIIARHQQKNTHLKYHNILQGRAMTLETFGSPRVGNERFAELITESFDENIKGQTFHRWVTLGDPVPMVPLSNILASFTAGDTIKHIKAMWGKQSISYVHAMPELLINVKDNFHTTSEEKTGGMTVHNFENVEKVGIPKTGVVIKVNDAKLGNKVRLDIWEKLKKKEFPRVVRSSMDWHRTYFLEGQLSFGEDLKSDDIDWTTYSKPPSLQLEDKNLDDLGYSEDAKKKAKTDAESLKDLQRLIDKDPKANKFFAQVNEDLERTSQHENLPPLPDSDSSGSGSEG